MRFVLICNENNEMWPWNSNCQSFPIWRLHLQINCHVLFSGSAMKWFTLFYWFYVLSQNYSLHRCNVEEELHNNGCDTQFIMWSNSSLHYHNVSSAVIRNVYYATHPVCLPVLITERKYVVKIWRKCSLWHMQAYCNSIISCNLFVIKVFRQTLFMTYTGVSFNTRTGWHMSPWTWAPAGMGKPPPEML